MDVITQWHEGRCGIIDVLEEAVRRRTAIAVCPRGGGETFIDEVVDVKTEDGDDFAVFRAHPPLPVGRIVSLTRAEGHQNRQQHEQR